MEGLCVSIGAREGDGEGTPVVGDAVLVGALDESVVGFTEGATVDGCSVGTPGPGVGR